MADDVWAQAAQLGKQPSAPPQAGGDVWAQAAQIGQQPQQPQDISKAVFADVPSQFTVPGGKVPLQEGLSEAQSLAAIASGMFGRTAGMPSPNFSILPNKVRAGAKIEGVANTSRMIPGSSVDPTAPAQIADRVMQLDKQIGAGTAPKFIKKFVARVANNPSALTWDEAQDWMTAAGKQSVREMQAMTGPMKAQVQQFATAMRAAMNETANSLNSLDQYTQGIREYSNAAKLQRASASLKKWGIRAAATAGLGAAGAAGVEAYRAASK